MEYTYQFVKSYHKNQIQTFYVKKTDFNEVCPQMNHYIFVLDDSGSMNDKWENVRSGALQCMKSIAKNGEAKVSVIIVNHKARVVIDCEKVNFDKQQDLITFTGGGTNFKVAFLQVLEQLLKHINKQFDNNIKMQLKNFATYLKILKKPSNQFIALCVVQMVLHHL